MCMWRCCLDVTLALAIRAKVKGPDRYEWSRLESWEGARGATSIVPSLIHSTGSIYASTSNTRLLLRITTQGHFTGLQPPICESTTYSNPTRKATASMVSYVKNYIQDQAMGYLHTGITAAGTMAGNAVGGVGGLIENGGRSVGQGTAGLSTPRQT